MKFLNKLKSDRQDLINNLNENIVSLEKIAFEQQAEIERLQKKVDYLKDANKRNDAHLHVRLVEQAKSEAIKEYAERLKEKAPNITEERFIILRNEIDNLVKEMVGDDNA